MRYIIVRILLTLPFFLLFPGNLCGQSVAIIYDQDLEPARKSVLDEFAGSLRSQLGLKGVNFTSSTWSGDTALFESVLSEWETQGDSGTRPLAEKLALQKKADEYIYLKLRDFGQRPLLSMHWIGSRNELKREGVIPLDIPFAGADQLTVRASRATEVLTGDFSGRWAGTLTSSLLPGVGQFTKAEPLKGGLLLGGSLLLAGMGGYSSYQALLSFNNYKNAANTTNRTFYYDQYSRSNLVALAGLGGYAALMILAGLDYFLSD